MPRINPLPEAECVICRRARIWREHLRCTRGDLAVRLGVDSAAIAAVELERTPLRYELARRYCRAGMNPHWLAGGVTEMLLHGVELPQATKLNVSDRELFSAVYSAHLRDEIQAKVLDEITPHFGWDREMAAEWVARRAKEWCDFVSEQHLDEFLVDLDAAANSLLHRYDTSRPQRKTVEAFITNTMHELQVGAMPATKPDSVLDKLPTTEDKGAVQRFPDLSEVLALAKQLTSPRGKAAELAGAVDVSPSRVSEWLSGKAKPDGEAALSLYRWVSEEQAKQKNAGAASTAPARKAQRRSSDETKPTSGRRKK